MKYVFGPVPSRRLGQSLGVDPIPMKTCNWNCVYCQLGRSAPLVHERRDYAPADEIVEEVQRALAVPSPGSIDWVTFGGSGEPTLHAHLGRMIREIKSLTEIPVAVLTNGALLHRPEVRDELAAADAVLPTLDAGSERVYRAVNRPWPGLGFDRFVEGLVAFAQEYPGALWVEVMLVRGLNDTEDALADIAKALARIQPDEVHVNVPVRPPAEASVEPPDERTLRRAATLLGASARVVAPSGGRLELSDPGGAAEAVLGVIRRHPLSERELRRAVGRWSAEEVGRALGELATAGRARLVTRGGERFWTAPGTPRFSSPGGSRRGGVPRRGCAAPRPARGSS